MRIKKMLKRDENEEKVIEDMLRHRDRFADYRGKFEYDESSR